MKFRAALGFFTRLPVGSAPLPPTFQGVIVWLPAIGLIVGLLAALAVALATLLLPAQLGGVIGCLVWVFITAWVASRRRGGLRRRPPRGSPSGTAAGNHEGLPTWHLRRSRTVLRASAQGHGTVHTGGVVRRKLERPPHPCGSLLHGRSTGAKHGLSGDAHPLSPTGGLGAALHNGVTRRHDMLALGIGLGICALNGGRGFTALIAALLVAWLLLSAAQKRLGGVISDVFGCLIELTESAVLVACCLR